MTRTLLSVSFWADASERALKSAAQMALAAFGADKVANVLNANWATLVGAAATGAVLSLLTSIASSGVGGTMSPASLAKEDPS